MLKYFQMCFMTSVGAQETSVEPLTRQTVWPSSSQEWSLHKLGWKYQDAIITYFTQLSLVFLCHQLLQDSDMKICSVITQCPAIQRPHQRDLKQTDVT